MEKVIAFKAFNGKLFETEEKCLAYEKKYAEYPKTEVNILPQVEGVEKYRIVEQKTPYATKNEQTFFLVNNLYKVSELGGHYVHNIPNVDVNLNEWQPLEKITCKVILDNNTFNDDLAQKICDIYDQCQKKSPFISHSGVKIQVTETDHKTYWVIEDLAWRTGTVSPNGRYVKIEKW